ncbi:non-specific lipid transfer protein GPI-anchored 8-like [Dioscorea cayenensis subsp. rotundata]|uniref:Non-specific lipid transfer protein GPI-anchored 8-like n=1 Tax=Dioscorea cayennensis subsp. rotundata TaxID=55577 RepID=A0AB40B3I5_DIOCR|nr:non-specific lipid transfer protein GPI-anchored 8-like [Dioscorea cayenensis subsp. rotundata]
MAGIQSSMVAIMAVFVLSMLAPAVFAQSDCVANLIPCENYLNNSHPPDKCCSPLKDAVQNQLACLCGIFESPNILKAFNINITQALQLSVNCGITSDTSLCSKTGAPSNSPPGNPANNGVRMLGMSGLLGLCLFWWSLVA